MIKRIISFTAGVIVLGGTIIGMFQFNSLLLAKEITAFQETLTTQRVLETGVELTAVVDRIIDLNIEIEKTKFFNQLPGFKLFVNNVFNDIKYIE